MLKNLEKHLAVSFLLNQILNMKSSYIALLIFIFPLLGYGAQVIGIADGDTMTILQDGKPLKLRLANIDAPEKRQSFGGRSKQSLFDLCWGKDVTYKVQDIDRYKRTVALVYCDGVEVNRVQVERGFAWVYYKYNKDSSLSALQNLAQFNRRGLFADSNPIPPWEFRHSK